MALTGKQAAFVEAYLIHRNKTRAAKDAGYAGTTENSFAAMGYHLFTNIQIQEAIKQRISESCMTADEVLERLGDQARADQLDIWDIPDDGGDPVLNLKKAKKAGKTHLIKKIKIRRTTRTITTDKGVTEIETVDTELDLYDAQNALVQLGRHHKLFTDKSELEIPKGIDIRSDDLAVARQKATEREAELLK